jgi:hypothetical protein
MSKAALMSYPAIWIDLQELRLFRPSTPKVHYLDVMRHFQSFEYSLCEVGCAVGRVIEGESHI